MFENHWIATEALAKALGLGQPVLDSLAQTFERWDGKGLMRTRGAACPLAARLTILVDVVEVYHRLGGVESAVAAARERSGTQFDPELVALFVDAAPELFDGLDSNGNWDAVIDAEPSLHLRLAEPELERALEAVADFADLKSPYALGHSRRVADLAASAAERAGHPADDVRLLRRAGLVHDIGRLGVPNTIWDKQGPLTAGDRERVRLHPYLERAHALRVAGARSARRDRRAPSRAARRLRLPARPARRRARAGRARARRRRRVRGDDRAAAAPARARARRGRRDRARGGARRAPRRPGRRCRARRGRAPGPPPARGPGRADRARDRGAASWSRAASRRSRSRSSS